MRSFSLRQTRAPPLLDCCLCGHTHIHSPCVRVPFSEPVYSVRILLLAVIAAYPYSSPQGAGVRLHSARIRARHSDQSRGISLRSRSRYKYRWRGSRKRGSGSGASGGKIAQETRCGSVGTPTADGTKQGACVFEKKYIYTYIHGYYGVLNGIRPNSQARTVQENTHFPCSADHEQDWQPYPVDPYSAICDDHTYIHTYIHIYILLKKCYHILLHYVT